MKSLRGQLIAFWVILLSVGIALALVMVVLFRSSAGAVIGQAQVSAEQSCRSIALRYARSMADPAASAPQIDLLHVLLQLVLLEAPHVEGGVWSASGGFLAYAYPTYEGTGVKRDIPDAEQAHIVEIAQVSARTQQTETDVVRGTREALVVSACPLQSPAKNLVAWTMTRASSSTLAAQGSLRLGLGALLVSVLASGAWLGAILLRGYRHVQRLESALQQPSPMSGSPLPLAGTGVSELDRLVDALNDARTRDAQARAHLLSALQESARDQRLAALGRMTGSIAHEIRNPIATMRLKAENALAASPETQGAALGLICEQIDRLDALVQSLLAVVQPVQLQIELGDVPSWLQQRSAAAEPQARPRGVRIEVDTESMTARFDPRHLGRAVDNLLDNALRHSPPGGRVSLRARLHGTTSWSIQVDDEGDGVPEALRASLFEPFTTGRADGTGLGLALAREVAIAHGGDLRYRPLARGSRFTLELPWRAS